MGMDIDNWIIKEQDRNIEKLILQVEKLKKEKDIINHELIKHLTEINYHINEMLKLKEKIRKLIGRY
jgi:hypothetical protein